MRRTLIWFLLAVGGIVSACTGSSGDSGLSNPSVSPTDNEAFETQSIGAESDTGELDPDPADEREPSEDDVADPIEITSPNDLPLDPNADAPQGPLDAAEVLALEPAFGGLVFDAPIELLPFDNDRVLLADRSGVVLLLDVDGNQSLVLDLRGRVGREGREEGLLSLALDPDFASNGHLWAYYSAVDTSLSRLSRFSLVDEVAAPESELIVLEVPQPFRNHNGGSVRFGADGFLYLGLGDGGAAGDPAENGQNLGSLLGSIVRLDVRNASTSQPYVIPGTNPFVGFPGVRTEIWAWGLRNPWRMSFDAATGALWVGDVGQGEYEEVNLVRRGNNLGWNVLEGNVCFNGECDASGFTPPIAVYDHELGCSVTGGVVVRRSGLPFLDGAYVYGDFCSGRVWVVDADLPGEAIELMLAPGNIASFGEDAQGNVYVLLFKAPIMRFVTAEAE